MKDERFIIYKEKFVKFGDVYRARCYPLKETN
jgi:hypothetical protein